MKLLFGIPLLILLLTSCTSQKSDEASTNPKKLREVKIEYAKNFNLKRSGDKFILETYQPGTKNVEQTLEIDPKKNQRIISLTSTLNGMICMLDERRRVIGVSSKNFLYDSQLLKRVETGKIKEFGGGASDLSLEKVASAKPNIILYDMIDKDFPNRDKLERLGVQMIPIFDWREAHPLAKAEWIKVVGAICGKYDEACETFDQIETSYKTLKTRKFPRMEDRPTVICGNMIGDAWYTPSGDNYFAVLIKDAGGNYRYSDTKGTVSLSYPFEKILQDNKNTEIWLNPGVPKKSQLLSLNPHLKYLNPFESGTYCYSANMNKFWETSAARPDLMLEDLIHIFNPKVNPEYEFHYYSKLKE